MIFGVIYLAVVGLVLYSFWKVAEKAGRPGWQGIVPVYNAIVALELVGRPLWWIAMLLIPCTMPIFGILLCIDIAKSFGKTAGFGVGLALLMFVFFPMLAFSDARYLGPSVAAPGQGFQPPMGGQAPPPPPRA